MVLENANELRTKFVHLLVTNMCKRIDYDSQDSYFRYMYFTMPLFMVLTVAFYGQFAQVPKVVLIWYLCIHAVISVLVYLYLLCRDITMTDQCINEILFYNPELNEALRVSAPH